MDQNNEMVRVLTFNLRRDMRHDRRNRWAYRRDLVARMISQSGASIVGVQELLPSMRRDIENMLSGYSVMGWGRCKNLSNEHSDIIVKNEDVQVSYFKTFWLSKNPDKFGSRAYFAIFPRICTVAETYVKELGCKIRVFNTHFDHICGPARRLGVKIILDYVRMLNEREYMPCVIMGDLNARPNNPAVKMLRENRYDCGVKFIEVLDKNRDVDTHHSFKGKDRWRIDYIFVSDDFEVVDAFVDQTNENGRYPSDHYPIVATLKLKNKK